MAITSVASAAGLTVNVLLVPLLKPLALAVSCLLPVTSICKSLKATMPFPAAVPRSWVVVPCSRPVPEVRDKVTAKVEGRPTVEKLPKASCDCMTGCVPKIEPAIALPG